MTVAVCFVAYHSRADVALCLAEVAGQTYADFDLVVCENGGAEATSAPRAAVPATLPGGQGVEVIDDAGNTRFASGCNVGMRARPGASAWWLLNPDIGPAEGALTALVARLARGDEQAAGAVLHFEDSRVQGRGGHWQGSTARVVSLGYGKSVDAPIDAAQVERDRIICWARRC